ncbi:MAG TPA: hypothetical protein VKB78_09865, partial [Pirellulales bacterium]|nr:hypothetical protein [Pirellulales bacterium]
MRFTLALFSALSLFGVGHLVAADSAGPRVIVDFADSKGIKLHGSQAEFTQVPLDQGQGLRITTEAAAQYPSVQIEPVAGKWDLSGFDGVETEVRNLQDAAVRVLLSVNNPGADGRNHCNVASAAVAPHEKATLTVPFGSWHGETNHPLDLANIVSLHVLLDRPGKSHTFYIGRIRAIHFGESRLPEIAADPFFKTMTARFGRGINLGNALEAPHEGDWGVTLKESYFEAIASAGFDSVRIPVRWSAHAAESQPYTIDK